MTTVGEQRYAKTFETGTVISRLRGAILIVSAVLSVVLLACYPVLSDSIPTHFTLLGKADDYGPSWSIFVEVGLVLAVILGLKRTLSAS